MYLCFFFSVKSQTELEMEKQKLQTAQEQLLVATNSLESARAQTREMREGFEKVTKHPQSNISF